MPCAWRTGHHVAQLAYACGRQSVLRCRMAIAHHVDKMFAEQGLLMDLLAHTGNKADCQIDIPRGEPVGELRKSWRQGLDHDVGRINTQPLRQTGQKIAFADVGHSTTKGAVGLAWYEFDLFDRAAVSYTH